MPRPNQPPKYDGHVQAYFPNRPPRKGPAKFIYVNGINTNPKAHLGVAEIIANITGCPVTGVYNETNGMLSDLKQCVGDWMNIVRNQVGEQGFLRDRLSQSAIDALSNLSVQYKVMSPWVHAMREAYIAPGEVVATKTVNKMRAALKRNLASLALFDVLTKNLDSRQIVVAHSQGNLITSFALWGVQAVYGFEIDGESSNSFDLFAFTCLAAWNQPPNQSLWPKR